MPMVRSVANSSFGIFLTKNRFLRFQEKQVVSKVSNMWKGGCWDKWVCHRNINPNAAVDKYVLTKLTNCLKTQNNLFPFFCSCGAGVRDASG